MAGRIEFNFSQVFDGVIWNTVKVADSDLLLVEVRDAKRQQAAFSALSHPSGKFLWRDVVFDESWWVTLRAASGDMALFTVYLDKDNPERKGVLAYHIFEQRIAWWNNDFSFEMIAGGRVFGVTQKYGRSDLVLDLATGVPLTETVQKRAMDEEVARPVQYLDNNSYFSTVKTFLNRQFNLVPVIALEYLEHDSNIFVSFYVQEAGLANYLLIMSSEGEALLKEKLGDNLTGIGIDTFFVLAGCVIFVKNKVELHSYSLI